MICFETAFGWLGKATSWRAVAVSAGAVGLFGLLAHPTTAQTSRTDGERAAADDAVCSPGWLHPTLLGQPDDLLVAMAPMAPAAQGPDRTGPDRAGLPPAIAAAASESAPQDAGIQSSTRPNDTLFRMNEQNLSLLTMGALDAWDISFGGDDVTIAVVADGVEYTHPDLANKIWRNPGEVPDNGVDDDGNGYVDDTIGWDFGGDAEAGPPVPDHDPMPVSQARLDVSVPAMGTALAGVAAAETNNGRGIAGVSWHARIMPLKINRRYKVPATRTSEAYWGIAGAMESFNQAVCYAADNGAQVIVIGASTRYNPKATASLQRAQDAITYARRKGVVVVAGAGECGQAQNAFWCQKDLYGENPPSFPAALDDVIGVQSFGPQYQMRPYSSFGDWVDIAAPGEGFSATWRTEQQEYKYIDGSLLVPSELAAAHVAGVVAVMRSLNPDYSVWDIEDKLCETANRSLPPHAGAFDDRTARGHARNDHFGCGALSFEGAVENMPWKMRIFPHPIIQMIDGTEALAKVPLVNPYLNNGHWEVVPEKAWLTGRPVPQTLGAGSLISLQLDVPGMKGDQGPLMAGSNVTPTVVVRAINVGNPDMQAASTPLKLDYRIKIVEHVSRAYLPSIVAR